MVQVSLNILVCFLSTSLYSSLCHPPIVPLLLIAVATIATIVTRPQGGALQVQNIQAVASVGFSVLCWSQTISQVLWVGMDLMVMQR